MRTPEEIKRALTCCYMCNSCGDDCPYDDMGCDIDKCTSELAKDALLYIEQLEERIQLMLIQMKGDCGVCKHRQDERKLDDKQMGCRLSPACYECLRKDGRSMWEYEGLPEV